MSDAAPGATRTMAAAAAAAAEHENAPDDAQTPADDASGALGWAARCVREEDGAMRCWVDMVKLYPNEMEGCIMMLWTVCLLLLRHLETKVAPRPEFWRGKRVLELGAGCGHLAVGLARLGAHVVATETGEIGDYYEHMINWSRLLLAERPGGGVEVATPLAAAAAGTATSETAAAAAAAAAEAAVSASVSVSPLYGQAYSAGDGAHGGTLSFRRLHWGLDDLPPSDWSGFDVIVMVELVYEESLHETLLETLRRLLKPGMVCYSAFVDRPYSLNFMALLCDDDSFEVDEIEFAEKLKMGEEEITYAHVITRKAEAS